MRMRAAVEVEADLAALRRTAERAGTALACLFSSSDEFEAEVVRVRRAQASGLRPAAPAWRTTLRVAALSVVFLML